MITTEDALYTFDAEAVAWLETRMWEAYYARQDARLFLLLVRLVRSQFGLSTQAAVRVALRWARPAMRFARMRDHYEAVIPDIAAAYATIRDLSGAAFDPADVAVKELRWWVVHRHPTETGLDGLTNAIAALYAAVYRVPEAAVRAAARLRAEACIVSDMGRERVGVRGASYWREVHALLRHSYHSLRAAVGDAEPDTPETGCPEAVRSHPIASSRANMT